MKPEFRTHVRQILDLAFDDTLKRIDRAVIAMRAENARLGRAFSDADVKGHSRIIEEEGMLFIQNTIDTLATVAPYCATYAMFRETLDRLQNRMQADFMEQFEPKPGARHVKRDRYTVIATPSIFGQFTKAAERHRLTFTNVPPRESESIESTMARIAEFVLPIKVAQEERALLESSDRKPAPLKQVKNGGRFPAEFWDRLWAAMAGQLYKGELIPKSQADIERAMLQWLENNDSSAADSTIRGRARLLWNALESDEN